MKTLLASLLLFVSFSGFAQLRKWEPVASHPEPKQHTANDTLLQGKKWYVDLSKREKIERLTVESEPRFKSYFYFKDGENFELNVNEADCKCTLAGTYLIHPVNMESNVQVRMQSLFELFAFEKNKDIPTCANGVVLFLEQFGLVADYYKSRGTIVFHRSMQETARPMR